MQLLQGTIKSLSQKNIATENWTEQDIKDGTSNFPLFHYTLNHDQTDFVAEKNICTRAFLAANILRYAIFRLSRKAAVTFIKAAGGETEEIRLGGNGGRACGGCVVDARTLRAAALVRTCTPVAVTTFVDATQSRRVTVVTSPTHTHTHTHRPTTLPWGSAHRGKWGQLTPPWKNGWNIKKRKHAKRAFYVIFWEHSGQAGVENGAMLTTY